MQGGSTTEACMSAGVTLLSPSGAVDAGRCQMQSSLLRCRKHRHGVKRAVAGTTVAGTSAGIPLLSLSRAGKVGTWSACKAYARCGCAEVGDQGNTPRGVGVRPTRVRTLRERNEVTRCQMASRCTKMARRTLAFPFRERFGDQLYGKRD